MNSWQESPLDAMVQPPRRSVRPIGPAAGAGAVGATATAAPPAGGSGSAITAPPGGGGGRPPATCCGGTEPLCPAGGTPIAPIEPQPHSASANAAGSQRLSCISGVPP